MHRIDGPGATADNRFTDGDPTGSVPATVVTDDWLNDVQEEILSVLTDQNITPAKGTQNQLLAAIKKLVANLAQATETVIGGAKVATQALTNAGVDDKTIITPKKLAAWFAAVASTATESAAGFARIATQAQTNAGTDDSTIVSPKKLRAGFAYSLSGNGFIALPSWLGGIIFQWGAVTRSGTGTINYTLPTAFPNAGLQGVVCNTDVNGVADIGLSSLSTTQVSISYDASTSVGGARYFVVGY